MDSKSQFTVDIISKVLDGRISINSAATLLSKSRRTIERYLSRYRRASDSSFMVIRAVLLSIKSPSHLRRSTKPIQTKYFDFNLQHLSELLKTNEGLSIKRETLLLGP